MYADGMLEQKRMLVHYKRVLGLGIHFWLSQLACILATCNFQSWHVCDSSGPDNAICAVL